MTMKKPVAKRHHMVSGTLAPLYTVFNCLRASNHHLRIWPQTSKYSMWLKQDKRKKGSIATSVPAQTALCTSDKLPEHVICVGKSMATPSELRFGATLESANTTNNAQTILIQTRPDTRPGISRESLPLADFLDGRTKKQVTRGYNDAARFLNLLIGRC